MGCELLLQRGHNFGVPVRMTWILSSSLQLKALQAGLKRCILARNVADRSIQQRIVCGCV